MCVFEFVHCALFSCLYSILFMGTKAIMFHKRLGGGSSPASSNSICRFWMEGRCNRNPCRFLHGEPQRTNTYQRGSKQAHSVVVDQPTRNGGRLSVLEGKVVKRKGGVNQLRVKSNRYTRGSLTLSIVAGLDDVKSAQAGLDCGNGSQSRKIPDSNPTGCGTNDKLVRKSLESKSLLLAAKSISDEQSGKEKIHSGQALSCLKRIRSYLQHSENSPTVSHVSAMDIAETKDDTSQKSSGRVCEHWISGNCLEGDRCPFLHSWSLGDGISMLAKLGGHDQAISGIGLPSASDKLYSGSYDGTVRIWDCHTGQLSKVFDLGDKIGSLICEGPWVFVGIPNGLKAWNTETGAEYSLDGPVGQVYAIIVALDMLFAGTQDGAIVVWKGSTENPNPFQLAVCLKGHSGAVTCMAVGAMRLYSGSMDGTIRVWDLDNLQCVCTINGHSEAVMSLIFCNQYLLSCSLDRTIKVWVATEGSNLEVSYTHVEEHGALTLCGVNDGDGRPILLCSCNDGSVHLYELPSFTDRGRLFSKKEIRTTQMGPGGLFFTGDGSGTLLVWKVGQARGGAL